MIRSGRALIFLLSAALLVPTLASAQQETRQTRDAERQLGLALLRPVDERAQFYERAMVHIRDALQRDPDSARVHYLHGQALAGLGRYQEADAAFRQALEMHPGYADEIEIDREQAWAVAFEQGLEYMGTGEYDRAITAMEGAALMYERPESFMNLANLYINAERFDDAERALRRALDGLEGPLADRIDPEQTADWGRFAELTRINLAQVLGMRGVGEFQAGRYIAAAEAFSAAVEVNPYGRDYWFNLAQSLYARTNELVDAIESTDAASRVDIYENLQQKYTEMDAAVERLLAFDPANENAYLLRAIATRGMADLAENEERTALQRRTLEALTRHSELPILIDGVTLRVDDADENRIVVQGTVATHQVEPGAPVRVRVTLVDITGAAIGESEVTLTAPPEEQAAQFEAAVNVNGEVAGWRYVIAG
jgi:tetratricopeptide (TPR) repeat protein